MSSKQRKKSRQPVRVMIKCSWSGARIAVPLSSEGDGPIKASSSISDVLRPVRSSLPTAVFEGESSILYLRRSVPRSEWDGTTLEDIGVGEEGSGGGGVLLTLNLAGGGTGEVGAVGSGTGSVGLGRSSAPAAAPAAAIPSSSAGRAADSVAQPRLAAAEVDPQPMDIDQPHPASLTTQCKSPSEALDLLLSSNFDADSRETVLTLLKIVDNVIAKPGDAKVRRIRMGNAAISKKILSRKGGLDFLLTVGFVAEPKPIPLLSGSVGGLGGGQKDDGKSDFIVLTEENEDVSKLMDARKLLASRAVNVLGLEPSGLPPLRTPPPLITAASHSAGARTSNRPGGEFDLYRTHSFNTQAAAAGVGDPTSVTPGSDGQYVSKTERELNDLKAKQARLEKRMQKLEDRGLVAARPGEVGAIVTLPSGDDNFGPGGGGGGKGDGALLAARMKKMEEERKKREEGGFTTKAMRDLEKMKKAKVYSHATVRVSFPDGCSVTGKFLPSERVRDVRSVVSEALLADLRDGLKFDLYVAPPRRLLDDARKLDEEGLVPAAKVHVSWKAGSGPPGGWEAGAYLRPELFAAAAAGSASSGDCAAEAFPDAKKLVDDGKGKKAASAGGGGKSVSGNGDAKAAREEDMMRRMLGGSKKGLLGRLGGKGKGKGGSSEGGAEGKKPKWFKG